MTVLYILFALLNMIWLHILIRYRHHKYVDRRVNWYFMFMVYSWAVVGGILLGKWAVNVWN